jgi:hypothetical protein
VKEKERLCSLPLAFTLSLAWAFCFGLFGVGSFWKIKEFLKGKELLKGTC